MYRQVTQVCVEGFKGQRTILRGLDNPVYGDFLAVEVRDRREVSKSLLKRPDVRIGPLFASIFDREPKYFMIIFVDKETAERFHPFEIYPERIDELKRVLSEKLGVEVS